MGSSVHGSRPLFPISDSGYSQGSSYQNQWLAEKPYSAKWSRTLFPTSTTDVPTNVDLHV